MAVITRVEKQAVAALAGIFALRMLGLFMILPVFPLYATHLNDTTPVLIGAAMGVYGLTQALLQIPFGFASDRFGRKPMIIGGLLLFAAGSAAAASSESIYGVIVGRSLQGASAIGCVIMALLSDLTRETIRQRAMAVIGVSIGLSFALAFVLGPFLSQYIGVQGIFWLTAILSLFAIVILAAFVPTPPQSSAFAVSAPPLPFSRGGLGRGGVGEGDSSRAENAIPILADIPRVFCMPALSVLNIGVLVLHASLVALFLKIPLAVQGVGFTVDQTWQFYLPVFLCSCLAMVPCLMMVGKKSYVKYGIVIMALLLAISELGIFYFFESRVGLAVSVWLFFTAFNTLEASLPTLVSKGAPLGHRGTALGIYSSAQFLGIFLGGIIGGWLDAHYGMVAILVFCIVLAIVWMVLEFTVNFKRGFRCQEDLIR